MSIESKLFGSGAFVFIPVAFIYGWLSDWEVVGTAGLLLTGGLAALVGGYLYITAKRIDPRPEDDPQALVGDGAGEIGFFSPWSWWPLPLALSGALIFLGLAVVWWIVLIGAFFALLSVVGLTFEYYRGASAH